ncbi:hypothetical protein DCC79_06820 [bacterium]|nr:MAG: hypothetical protein DCC79_06820 [bacterium]
MPTDPDELDRPLPHDARDRAWLETTFPDAAVRQAVLGALADAIEAAHAIGHAVWSLSHYGHLLRLNVGRSENMVIAAGRVYFVAESGQINDAVRAEVEACGKLFRVGSYSSLPTACGVQIPSDRVADLYPLLREAHLQVLRSAAAGVVKTPYRRSHDDVMVRQIGAVLGRDLPQPYLPDPPDPPPLPVAPPRALVARTLTAAGLRFTASDVADVYTALQTKGFVVLAGITGTGKTKLVQHLADLLADPEPGRAPGAGDGAPDRSNCLFLSVRPDWRDVKSLVGYFNPLARTWEWTPFLEFVVGAADSFRTGDGVPRFVILDEMNLAHVEHYFADVLSVMESGRDADGLTRAPLRLTAPDDAEGRLPPRELYLPPNLYVVGTVNMDETTYAFSPKVLDRAFTVELGDVDLRGYPPLPDPAGAALTLDERLTLVEAFTRGGRHARIDKAAIAAEVQRAPWLRDDLARLNDRLARHDMHFGYRVFDEIVSFVAAARANGMYAFAGDAAAAERAAFDGAVRMKVLPKFHGSRGRLEAPLLDVVAWCVDPSNPPVDEVHRRWADGAEPVDPTAALAALDFRVPRTGRRALRLLRALAVEGFAGVG